MAEVQDARSDSEGVGSGMDEPVKSKRRKRPVHTRIISSSSDAGSGDELDRNHSSERRRKSGKRARARLPALGGAGPSKDAGARKARSRALSAHVTQPPQGQGAPGEQVQLSGGAWQEEPNEDTVGGRDRYERVDAREARSRALPGHGVSRPQGRVALGAREQVQLSGGARQVGPNKETVSGRDRHGREVHTGKTRGRLREGLQRGREQEEHEHEGEATGTEQDLCQLPPSGLASDERPELATDARRMPRSRAASGSGTARNHLGRGDRHFGTKYQKVSDTARKLSTVTQNNYASADGNDSQLDRVGSGEWDAG
jgi:hypothetical protein